MAPHPDDQPHPNGDSSSTLYKHQNSAVPTSTLGPYSNQWNMPLSTPASTDSYGNTVYIIIDPYGNAHTATLNEYGQNAASQTLAPSAAKETSSNANPTSIPSYPTSSPKSHSQPTSGFPIAAGAEQNHHHHNPFPGIIAAGIMIPLLFLILGLFCFFFCIKPRRQKQHARAQSEGGTVEAARRVPEMKHVAVGGRPDELSQRALGGPSMASPTIVPPTMSPSATSSSSTGTPPVILSTTMNSTYYTGIDTSDHISLTDQRSEASSDTFGDEPPPPYRPRSVPPISREASVRNSICRNASIRSNRNDPMSGSNLIGGVRRSVDVRSPFDDPEDSDDDNLSQISTLRSLPRHDTDRLSVVSDLSYQGEPTSTHSTV